METQEPLPDAPIEGQDGPFAEDRAKWEAQIRVMEITMTETETEQDADLRALSETQPQAVKIRKFTKRLSRIFRKRKPALAAKSEAGGGQS